MHRSWGDFFLRDCKEAAHMKSNSDNPYALKGWLRIAPRQTDATRLGSHNRDDFNRTKRPQRLSGLVASFGAL